MSPARSKHDSPPVPSSAAWAAAWAGDLEAASRLAREGPQDAANLGVLGAVAVIERRPEAALDLLSRAIALGGREDLVLHQARALVHIGRLEDAARALESLVDGESFARRTVHALVMVRRGMYGPTYRTWLRSARGDELFMNGFFANELPAAVGPAEIDRATTPEALADLLERLLGRMAGNLGPSPTLAEVAPGGGRRFVPLVLPPTTRAQAVDALDSLRHVGPAGAERALAELRARNPRSVHPRCYMGELYLWLGRYGEAWREFVAARSIAPARWADIGMLAVLIFRGHLRLARLAAIYAERHHTFIPGGTLPVYRGVLRRRLGDLGGAIEDLQAALEAKPTRIGARIELALALRAAGRRMEVAPHSAILLQDARPVLVDAAASLGSSDLRDPDLVGDAVLEEALRSMRGNRSSTLVTWVDRSGEVRTLNAPSSRALPRCRGS